MRSTLTILVCGALLLGTGAVMQLRSENSAAYPIQGADGKTYYQVDLSRQKEMERVSEGVGVLGIVLVAIGAFRWTRPVDFVPR
jgi:hypothetical protein